MKISIDYDGTMWSHMAFFRELMKAMQLQGHQVGVLTGHNEECREADIALMVDRGFPRPDFWFGRTAEYQPMNGSIFKSAVIEREGIDIHFDDCDFGNQRSREIFEERLGAGAYRVFKVPHREPTSIHYE